MSSVYSSTPLLPGPQPQQSFPFLRLPPELRNEVYRHLLISRFASKEHGLFHVPPGMKCSWGTYTAVLCTNRQIFFESRSIFYGENLFTVNGFDDHLWFADKDLPSRARKSCRLAPLSVESIHQIQRWKFVFGLNPYFRTQDEGILAPSFHRLKRDINHLCQRMAQCHRLKEVTVAFYQGERESPEPAFATGTGVLEPFTTIRGAEKVTIRGDLTDEYAGFLRQLMQGPKVPSPSRFEFLKLPLRVREKIYRYMLVDEMEIEPFPRSYETSVRRLCPNILATNKQVFNEAGTIFHNDNAILFEISRFTTFRHDIMEVCVGSSLRRFRNFRVLVTEHDCRGAVASAVNMACLLLVSVLRLDCLRINSIDYMGFWGYPFGDELFYPLQRLCNVGNVYIEGHISPQFGRYLKERLQKHHPGHICPRSPHDAFPNLPWQFSDIILPITMPVDTDLGIWRPPPERWAIQHVLNTTEWCRECNELGPGMSQSSVAYLTKYLKRGEL